MEQGVVRPSDISASYRANLLKSKNAALQKLAERAFATSINPDRQKVVEQYQSALTLSGDAARGAEHFKKICAKCHQFAGEGTLAGPDLAALTDKSPANLLASVLDPNRAVEPRYLAYTAETADGRIFTGMLLNESGGSITLLAADGNRHELLRSELVDLESTGVSLMPDGLEKDLAPQDLADLFALIARGKAD
jgi:putative heme-binding domain-containing protein